MDSAPGAMTYNWQPGATQWPPNPEVRYTGGVPIMFESGTKGQPLPNVMYGCPYPPSADGKCNVSPRYPHSFLQLRSLYLALWLLCEGSSITQRGLEALLSNMFWDEDVDIQTIKSGPRKVHTEPEAEELLLNVILDPASMLP